MEYLAHSARDGSLEQSYYEHVSQVKAAAIKNAELAASFAAADGQLLEACAELSAEYHDLGKLEDDNQKILHTPRSHQRLPINHTDAGVAFLKSSAPVSDRAQMMIFSHHLGLPDFYNEKANKEDDYFRDDDYLARRHTNSTLDILCQRHQTMFPTKMQSYQEVIHGDSSVFSRIQLSCLTDADHSDTAIHYGAEPKTYTEPALRAEERLRALDHYVSKLQKTDERSCLRSEMYEACRNAVISENIVACDSPVGSGKTTAVMAHLLKQAILRKARRVFVVLPFTNIISQSVNTYRQALVLPGEDPEAVVAELHHRADFENEILRSLTGQWRAPIIVTTAVAFFETLASNQPSTLRRLHELPGSVIFVDEAHAALPVRLLPLAWRWMQIYADEWSCYWVLASGSLVRFWEIKELADLEGAKLGESQPKYVPNLIASELRERLSCYEQHRIKYSHIPKALSRSDLVNIVFSKPGPRLLIMNTVKSAAVLARDLSNECGESANMPNEQRKVLHLSTALNAEDRESTIRLVQNRLKDLRNTDWTLVATSCVEAGVDFSFRTGFREIASLLSLLQTSGRIGRNGEYLDAEIWSFKMQDDKELSKNKSIDVSISILERFFNQKKEISPALSTRAIQNELNRSAEPENLLEAEQTESYKTVSDNFRVIDSNTVLAIADDALKKQIGYGQCSWRAIQRKAFTIYYSKAQKLGLTEIAKGLYNWDYGYDSFLGYMAGVLNLPKEGEGVFL